MINQSFVVKDFRNEETYEFLFISENNWSIKRWGEEFEMTQEEVQIHYNYFTSLWRDYDVTLLESAQNTPPTS